MSAAPAGHACPAGHGRRDGSARRRGPRPGLVGLWIGLLAVQVREPGGNPKLVLGAVLSVLGVASNVVWALGAGAVGRSVRRRDALVRRGTAAAYAGLAVVAAVVGGRRTG